MRYILIIVFSLLSLFSHKITMATKNTANATPAAPAASRLDPKEFPETTRFAKWHATEVQTNELRDVKFFAAKPAHTESTTLESFFGEVNDAIEAKPQARKTRL